MKKLYGKTIVGGGGGVNMLKGCPYGGKWKLANILELNSWKYTWSAAICPFSKFAKVVNHSTLLPNTIPFEDQIKSCCRRNWWAKNDPQVSGVYSPCWIAALCQIQRKQLLLRVLCSVKQPNMINMWYLQERRLSLSSHQGVEAHPLWYSLQP